MRDLTNKPWFLVLCLCVFSY